MRGRTPVGALLAVLLVAAGGPGARAENENFYRSYELRQAQDAARRARDPYAGRRGYDPYGYGEGYGSPYGRPPPGYYGRYQPPPPPPPPPQRQFYWPWEQRPPAPEPQPLYAPRRPRSYAGETRRRPPRPPVAAAREPVLKPKTNPTTVIAVFGDSLADLLGEGLDDAYEENADVVVFRRAKADSGLARRDIVDWPKAAAEYLAANPRVNYAVVMFAANDRQPLRDGEASVEPLTDRWRELYRERVDAMIKVFTDKAVPLIWVGAPPMRNDKLSADLGAINDIYRERVQRAGGVYVDIWPGFVNDENRYSATGPDLEGQSARLRLNDGVHFTFEGSRKAAHFADVEIKRLMEAKAAPATPPEAVAAAPPPISPSPTAPVPTLDSRPGEAPAVEGAPDRQRSAALPGADPPGAAPPGATPSGGGIPDALPASIAPAAPPAPPPKPVAGPVLPLTRVEISPGGALVAPRPRPEGETAAALARGVARGTDLPVPTGRADDFRWRR